MNMQMLNMKINLKKHLVRKQKRFNIKRKLKFKKKNLKKKIRSFHNFYI